MRAYFDVGYPVEWNALERRWVEVIPPEAEPEPVEGDEPGVEEIAPDEQDEGEQGEQTDTP
jgi:hypothetical protein